MQRRRIATLVLAGCLVALAAPAVTAAKDAPKQAPALQLTDPDGNPAAVEYADSAVTLVNFWATWCIPCREEMPQIDRLAKRYGERGFRAVGIAVESETSEIRELVEGGSLDLSYPLLVGDLAVGDGFGGVEIVPTTFLVGRDGMIRSRHIGVTPDFEASLSAEIEELLAAGEAAQGKPAR